MESQRLQWDPSFPTLWTSWNRIAKPILFKEKNHPMTQLNSIWLQTSAVQSSQVSALRGTHRSKLMIVIWTFPICGYLSYKVESNNFRWAPSLPLMIKIARETAIWAMQEWSQSIWHMKASNPKSKLTWKRGSTSTKENSTLVAKIWVDRAIPYLRRSYPIMRISWIAEGSLYRNQISKGPRRCENSNSKSCGKRWRVSR